MAVECCSAQQHQGYMELWKSKYGTSPARDKACVFDLGQDPLARPSMSGRGSLPCLRHFGNLGPSLLLFSFSLIWHLAERRFIIKALNNQEHAVGACAASLVGCIRARSCQWFSCSEQPCPARGHKHRRCHVGRSTKGH